MPNPPVDPSLEERGLEAAIVAFGGAEGDCQEARRHMLGQEGGKALYAALHAYLAALTTEDLKALLSARSDEVVVGLSEGEAEIVRWLIEEYEHSDNRQGGNQHNTSRRLLASFRSKLSTALESE